jgi:hypothetical protein
MKTQILSNLSLKYPFFSDLDSLVYNMVSGFLCWRKEYQLFGASFLWVVWKGAGPGTFYLDIRGVGHFTSLLLDLGKAVCLLCSDM